MSAALRRSLIAFTLIVAALGYVGLNWKFTTDISEFIPEGEDRAKAQLSRAIVDSELSRTILLSIRAPNTAGAVNASRAFEERLRADAELMGLVSFIDGGPPSGSDRALWELYEPRRLAFAARNVAEAHALVSDAGLDGAVAELRRRLESPLSTVVSRVAPEDPLLSVPRLLEASSPGGGALNVVDGRFIADERHAIVFVGTRGSAFDADAQRAVFARLHVHFAELDPAAHQLELESAGLARFSMNAEQTIQSDLQRISVLSILGMLAVCIVLFRSVHLVLLPWLPIGCGMLAGTCACILFFGSLHGMTLAIGSSLIGVCIDYITHFYVHHLLGPQGVTPQQTMRKVLPGLVLGGLTTITGFALLAGSSFPGLRQIATFSSVGIGVALISTCYLAPQCMPKQARTPALLRRAANRLSRLLTTLHRKRGLALVLPIIAIALTVMGVLRTSWDGDLSRLTAFDPELKAEDERVRSRVAQYDQSRFAIALGNDDAQALEANDALVQALSDAKSAGEVASFQGISPLLPSPRLQAEVATILRGASLRERLGSRLEAAGFNRESFEPFFAFVETTAMPQPLHYEDLSSGAAGALVRSFRVKVDGRIGYVSFLRGVSDVSALDARLSALPGVTFVDQTALMRSASTAYNHRITQLLLVGLGLVFLILVVRYRSAAIAIATFLPAVLSAGVTIFVLSLLHLSLNVLALTGLLMVLSMGVDYSVFMAESVLDPGEHDDLGPTLLGVVVDWFTTVFGFGVLALSQHPAMRTIGVVAGVGITAALLLAPVALAAGGIGSSRTRREAVTS